MSFAFSQSVYAQSATVDTSQWPANITVTAPVTNTGLTPPGGTPFTPPFTSYFVYYNTLNQVVLIDQVPWSSSQTTVSDSGFTPQSVPGAGSTLLGFSVNVFFIDSTGRPMGPSLPAYATFSVPIHFWIFYSGVGGIVVSPPGSGVQQCSSNCAGGFAYYEAYWTSGTPLTVTTTSGVAPVTWDNNPNDICPATSGAAGFTCSFKVSPDYNAFISGSSSLPSNSILVYSINGGGGVSPLEICLSAQSYTFNPGNIPCGPSGTFSLTQPAAWSVEQQNTGAQLSPPVSGSGTSATLTFSQLQGQVTFSGGLAALNFVTQAPSILTIQAPVTPGASITPTPGTYTCSSTSSVCQPGGTVQLTATAPSGYQFQDWIVNGQEVSTSASYSLPIPATGATAVAAVFAPSGTPPPPPPPPCSGPQCSSSSSGSIIPWIVGPPGALLLLLGFVMKKPARGHFV